MPRGNHAFFSSTHTASQCKLITSVCTGSLLLGAAGLLHSRRATTHPTAFELLKPYVKEVVDAKVVDEGDIITARGVTSSINLGLHLVNRLWGVESASIVRKSMDYTVDKWV